MKLRHFTQCFLPLNADFLLLIDYLLFRTKCSLMSFINTSSPSDDKSTMPVGMRVCFSFQQNSKVGMTVRTCICNVFEYDIHCKIDSFLSVASLLHTLQVEVLNFCFTFASFSSSKIYISLDWASGKLVPTSSTLFKLILYQN